VHLVSLYYKNAVFDLFPRIFGFSFWLSLLFKMPVPVAALSKALVCGRWPAESVGSSPTGAWMFVCCECCVLSGRGLCDELITRPEESYRL